MAFCGFSVEFGGRFNNSFGCFNTEKSSMSLLCGFVEVVADLGVAATVVISGSDHCHNLWTGVFFDADFKKGVVEVGWVVVDVNNVDDECEDGGIEGMFGKGVGGNVGH